MPAARIPCIANERFLQPIFDDAGIVQTMRLIEPGDRSDLTNVELAALGNKAKAAPPEPPAGPGP